MPSTPSEVDQAALYGAALQGLELQKQRLEEQIGMVRSLIGGKKTRAAAPASVATAAPAAPAARKAKAKAKAKAKGKPRKKRILSPEARERIAIAQRKRWAVFRGDSDS